MSYFLQGGIDRSKKFGTELAAKRYLNTFLNEVRLSKIRLKKEGKNKSVTLVAIYDHNTGKWTNA